MNNYKKDDDELSILDYVIENYHKFFLLILVFVIIYFVDYITNINAVIYGHLQLSQQMLPLQMLPQKMIGLDKKIKKPKNKKTKK